MKRNYEIVHFLKDNEWSIRRTNNEEEWWLSKDGGNPVWTHKKEWARRFFHEETAIQALMIVKTKWKEIKEEQQYKQEKQSWSELS